MATSVQPNVGSVLPDLDWVERGMKLFRDGGPYLIAILFLALALSLVFSKGLFPKVVAGLSFLFAVVSAVFGMYIWAYSDTGRLNLNVKYVLLYQIRDPVGALQAIDKVELPLALTDTAQGYASLKDRGTITLMVVSKNPIANENISALYLFFKDSDSPTVFCPARLSQANALEIVRDATTNPPVSGRFLIKFLRNSSDWEDVQCND